MILRSLGVMLEGKSYRESFSYYNWKYQRSQHMLNGNYLNV